jgi:heterotetrameric sarcosine oxidase delta subunit
MRINCPICGERDKREFHYRGSAKLMSRPASDAGEAAFYDYTYLRDNPAGPHAELWCHDHGCRAWLVVERDTTTHEFLSVQMVRDVPRNG